MHSVALRVTKNTLAQIVTYGVTAASKFSIVIFIARLSSAEDVGDFSSLLLIPLGATVYVLSLFLFQTFSDSERRVLLNMVRGGGRKIRCVSVSKLS